VTCVTYSPDFCPVEMGRITGQHDDAARRIGVQLVRFEFLAEADVEEPEITV
jgi:hypothetical protein